MKRVFVSMPMKDKPTKLIVEERKLICKKIEELLGEEYKDWKLIDSIYYDESELDSCKNKAVYRLAYSIKCLADADVAYFAKGWENARGCKIENEIAKQYEIEIVEE